MKRSTDRILTTHAGSLPRPDDLWAMVTAKRDERSYDATALAQRGRTAVAEVVRRQLACGIDCVNDGEISKTTFTDYVRDRLGGLDPNPPQPYVSLITGRDSPARIQSRRRIRAHDHEWRVWAMAEGAKLASEELWG